MSGAYVALLRGINVGGNNLIAMPDLAATFADAGFDQVKTYIQSGNVVFSGRRPTEDLLEKAIADRFGLQVPVLLVSRDALADVVSNAPEEFDDPAFRPDVIFLKRPLTSEEAIAGLPALADGIDRVWPGPGVVYFARLDAQRTKSRLNKVMGTPLYRQMSVRNWNTTRKLLSLCDAIT